MERIYLDNAATTRVRPEAVQAALPIMTEIYGNPSSIHSFGREAKKALEKEAERAPIRDAIMAVMTTEPKTATTLIAEAGVEIKPQAIPSLLRGLCEEGIVVKTEVKVTGKGKQRGYALAE